jgi:hypothetical protein
MRDPEQIRQVLDTDPMYGPDHDMKRHNIGIEYERKLESLLTIIGTFILWSSLSYIYVYNLHHKIMLLHPLDPI